jgi:hypothetical protein
VRDVYTEVTEEEYESIQRERMNQNFIEDDGLSLILE